MVASSIKKGTDYELRPFATRKYLQLQVKWRG